MGRANRDKILDVFVTCIEALLNDRADVEYQRGWEAGKAYERIQQRSSEPMAQELCMYHDMGKEFGPCSCPAEHPNRVTAKTGLGGNARALGDESC